MKNNNLKKLNLDELEIVSGGKGGTTDPKQEGFYGWINMYEVEAYVEGSGAAHQGEPLYFVKGKDASSGAGNGPKCGVDWIYGVVIRSWEDENCGNSTKRKHIVRVIESSNYSEVNEKEITEYWAAYTHKGVK